MGILTGLPLLMHTLACAHTVTLLLSTLVFSRGSLGESTFFVSSLLSRVFLGVDQTLKADWISTTVVGWVGGGQSSAAHNGGGEGCAPEGRKDKVQLTSAQGGAATCRAARTKASKRAKASAVMGRVVGGGGETGE